MSLLSELKRRNVFRVAIAYSAFCVLLLQVVDFTLDLVTVENATTHVLAVLAVLAALGLPCVMVFAWKFEITPGGIKRDSEVPREESIRAQTGYQLNRLTMVIVIVLVVFLVTNRDREMLDSDEGEDSHAPVAEEQSKGATG